MRRSTQREVKIAERRREVARQYLSGKYQPEIAVMLNVSQKTISNDIEFLQHEWLKSSLMDFNEAKARELARIDHFEITNWDAYERSRKDKSIKSAKEKESTRETSKEKSARLEERDGDPRFLDNIKWCIEQRLKIFGLYAAQKFDVGWREHAERSGVDAGAAFEAMVQFYASAVAGADGSGSTSGSAAQTTENTSGN